MVEQEEPGRDLAGLVVPLAGKMSRQGDIRTTDRAFDAWMDREFPGLSAPCGSADLKDVESDDDAAFNGVRALVGIDGAVGLLRGEPSGDDIT